MIRNISRYGFGAFSALALAGCSYEGGDTALLPDSGKAVKDGYTISVGTAEGTRAQLEGDTWMWSPSDKVGFYIQNAATSEFVASNVKLRSLNTAAALSARFEGELAESQIRQIDAGGSYNYYAYYPYSDANTGGISAAFTIPADVTAAPGDMNVPVFMTAKVANRRALTHLLDDGTQAYTGEKVGFQFEQRLAYMDLYLALNLMSQDITKITVTSSAGALAGAVSFDVAGGTVTPVSGSDRIVINIPAGIRVGSGDVRVAVMPQTFPAGATLKFVLENKDNSFETTVDVGGKTFAAGQNHRIGLRTSFYLSFENMNGNETGGSQSSFTYKNYYVWSDNISRYDYAIRFYHGWFGDNDMIRINLLTDNTYGAATIPVKVTLDGKRNGIVDSDMHLQYAAVSPSATSFSGTKVQMPHHVNITGNTGFDKVSFNMSFTEANSAFGLKSVFNGIDATMIFVRSIRIEPVGL